MLTQSALTSVQLSSTSEIAFLVWSRSGTIEGEYTWYKPESADAIHSISIEEHELVRSVCWDDFNMTGYLYLVLVGTETETPIASSQPREERRKRSRTIQKDDSDSRTRSCTSRNHQGRWMKVNDGGYVLFSRSMEKSPENTCVVKNTFIALSKLAIDLWDVNYGVITHSIDMSCPFSQPLPKTQTPLLARTLMACPVVGNDAFHVFLSTWVDVGGAKPTVSVRSTLLRNPSYKTAGTLLQAFGNMTELEWSAENISNSSEANEWSDKCPYKILGGLPNSAKRELVKGQKKLETLRELDTSDEWDDKAFARRSTKNGNGKVERSATSNNSSTRLLLDISTESCRSFLSRVQHALEINKVYMETEPGEKKAFLPAPFLPSDWDAMRYVLRCGVVAITSYPLLIPEALAGGRIDVLQSIAQCCSDLSEVNAVRILRLTMLVSEENLARLSFVNRTGMIVWGKVDSGASGVEGIVSGDTKKKRKSRVSSSSSSPPSSSASSQKDDHNLVQPATHLTLLRAVLEAILRRHDSFSPILLAEAMRAELNITNASLLLRVLVLLMKGICPSVKDDDGISLFQKFHLGSFRDAQIARAVTWAESLLDAHFTSFALALSTTQSSKDVAHSAPSRVKRNDNTNSSTSLSVLSRMSIIRALEAVAGVEVAKEETEALMGSWEQVLVMNQMANQKDKRGRLMSSAPVGIYQEEMLYL